MTNDFNGLTTLAGAEIPSGTTVVWTPLTELVILEPAASPYSS